VSLWWRGASRGELLRGSWVWREQRLLTRAVCYVLCQYHVEAAHSSPYDGIMAWFISACEVASSVYAMASS